VHKKVIWVAVRLPGQEPGQRAVTVRRFKAFWRSLQKMAGWLAELGLTSAAMEARVCTGGRSVLVAGLPIAGERDPVRLAGLALGVLRRKTDQLQMACDGRFTASYGQMCQLHLDAYDHLIAQIAELDALVAEAAAPFQAIIARLVTIPRDRSAPIGMVTLFRFPVAVESPTAGRLKSAPESMRSEGILA
jgi:hypothetical protein